MKTIEELRERYEFYASSGDSLGHRLAADARLTLALLDEHEHAGMHPDEEQYSRWLAVERILEEM